MERVQGRGKTVGKNASLGLAWLSPQKSLVLQVEAQYSCRGSLRALTAGSSSRRAVRESRRTLAMVLPALESQSPPPPPATAHTALKGRKDSTACHLQRVPRPGFQPWLTLGTRTPSLFHPHAGTCQLSHQATGALQGNLFLCRDQPSPRLHSLCSRAGTAPWLT